MYGDKTLTNYLDHSVFALPAPGTFGKQINRGIEGPGFWTADISLARLLTLASSRTLELRVEAFNLFNNFNWGNPNTNYDAATFGKVTSQNGDSRIMQFAVKYGF